MTSIGANITNINAQRHGKGIVLEHQSGFTELPKSFGVAGNSPLIQKYSQKLQKTVYMGFHATPPAYFCVLFLDVINKSSLFLSLNTDPLFTQWSPLMEIQCINLLGEV